MKGLLNIISKDNNGNMYVGYKPTMQNSMVTFEGRNNVVYCEPNVIIEDSKLTFKGNNSLIYLRAGKHKLKVYICHDCVCHCGSNNYYAKPIHIILSEQKHFFVGAASVVSGKVIPHNTIWAGNPTRQINNDIFWDKKSVHDFDEQDTELSLSYES